jgi:MGT family glycosyltransferase
LAHFALIAPPLTGHYKPLATLAAELVSRGHRATFVHQADAEPVARRWGGDFHALEAQGKTIESWTRPMAKIRGLAGLGGTIADMARQTDLICRQAPSALREIGADAVLADQLEAGGGIVAEHLGLPWISVASALPINREPGVPPPYVGWAYDPSDRGRWWNEGAYRISDLLMRRVGDVVEHHSRAFRLKPRRRIEDCFSPRLQAAQAVAGIDLPRQELPPSFHYLGPFRSTAEEPFELPSGLNKAPLVYCSLGTLQGSRFGLFRNIAAACADLGLNLIITHGGLLSAAEAAALPRAPMVHDFVPQEAVLAHADLVVSHAGFNTVLDALAAGLPMVAVPIAFEQPAIAARLTRSGVAEVVTRRGASRGALRAAIDKVLREPSYRARAKEIQQEIAVAGGVRRAADLVEASLSRP